MTVAINRGSDTKTSRASAREARTSRFEETTFALERGAGQLLAPLGVPPVRLGVALHHEELVEQGASRLFARALVWPPADGALHLQRTKVETEGPGEGRPLELAREIEE